MSARVSGFSSICEMEPAALIMVAAELSYGEARYFDVLVQALVH